MWYILYGYYVMFLWRNFSVMGKTVFYSVKTLMERWYLLVTEKFLFWTFRWWEVRSFMQSKKVDGKMIFTGYSEVLVLNFSVMENTAFFQPKSWWKDDIYVVFLSFPWYCRTWKIWSFAQWQHKPSPNIDFHSYSK